MRPISLELENFGVYLGRHSLDFSPLNFFVIKGRTGSGKSTLIDAICYALFGAVPRYGGVKAHKYLISKGQKRMYVALEFSVKGERYRVERAYEVRKGGDDSELRFYEGGKLRPIKDRDFVAYIKDLLRLDYKTFTRVLLLPQNQFDRFLKPGDKKERTDILNSLLGFSTLFSSLKELVKNEHNQLNSSANFLQSRLSQLQDATPERIRTVEENLQTLQAQYQELLQERAQAQGKLQRCRERDNLLAELSKLQQNLQEMNSKKQDMQRLRERLELALELLPYLPRLEEYESLTEQEEDYRRRKTQKELELRSYSEEIRQVEEELKKIEQDYRRIGEYNQEVVKLNQTLQTLGGYWQLQRELQTLQEDLAKTEKDLQRERLSEKEVRDRFLQSSQLLRELQDRTKAYEWAEEKIVEAQRLEDQLRRLQEGLAKREKLAKELAESEKALLAQQESSEKALKAYERLNQEIEELRQRLEELRKDVQQKEELLRREAKAQELLQKARELEGLLLQKQKLQRERERLAQELQTLQEELRELEGRKLELYAAEIRSSLEPGSVCPVCGGVVGEKHPAETSEDLSLLSDRLAQTERRKEDLTKEISAKDTQISLLEERSQGLSQELQGAQRDDIERELSYLQEKLRELREKELALGKAQGELDQLMVRQRELFRELQTLQSKEAELKSQLSSKSTQLKDLQTEIEELEKALGKSPEQVLQEVENIKRGYQELKRVRERERSCLKELEELQRELSESQKRLAGLEERKKGLELQLEDRKGKAEELQREITLLVGEPVSPHLERELKRKAQELSQKIVEVQEQYAKCNEYLTKMKAKEANLRSDLQNIDSFLENLKRRKSAIAGELYQLENRFENLEEARKNLLKQEEIRALQQELESYEKNLHALESRLEELQRALAGFEGLPETAVAEGDLLQVEKSLHQNRETYGTLREVLEKLKKELQERQELEAKLREVRAQLELYERLKSDFGDSQFPEFVSQLMLRQVADRANYYFFKLTSGQFTFKVVEGDLQVLDHSTGQDRTVSSLSGGETFLASLSLAFAVADILSQNAPLESLFIDEGFGSLDGETRESLSDFFDLVRESTNRMVGIITHVEDVAQKFSQRIEVEKKDGYAQLKVVY